MPRAPHSQPAALLYSHGFSPVTLTALCFQFICAPENRYGNACNAKSGHSPHPAPRGRPQASPAMPPGAGFQAPVSWASALLWVFPLLPLSCRG